MVYIFEYKIKAMIWRLW